jgi:hypothetical protein
MNRLAQCLLTLTVIAGIGWALPAPIVSPELHPDAVTFPRMPSATKVGESGRHQGCGNDQDDQGMELHHCRRLICLVIYYVDGTIVLDPGNR